MKTKLMVVVSVMALLLCGAAMIASAQGPGGPEGPGFHGPHSAFGPMGHMLHELNLTDAQKEQVKSLMQANHANMKTVMQQMSENRKALLTATANGAYDPAKIQLLANQQAQLQAAMTVQHEALQHQIYTTILTPEQRLKADQFRADELSRITAHELRMSKGGDTPVPPTEQ
jgi:protein CpxP